jgi:hypothetical protein
MLLEINKFLSLNFAPLITNFLRVVLETSNFEKLYDMSIWPRMWSAISIHSYHLLFLILLRRTKSLIINWLHLGSSQWTSLCNISPWWCLIFTRADFFLTVESNWLPVDFLLVIHLSLNAYNFIDRVQTFEGYSNLVEQIILFKFDLIKWFQ